MGIGSVGQAAGIMRGGADETEGVVVCCWVSVGVRCGLFVRLRGFDLFFRHVET